MLLVVVETEDEQIVLQPLETLADPLGHAAVDLGAVGQHLVERRPGLKAALGPFDPVAEALVVGVEQALEAGIDRLVTRLGRQNHRLEEPAGVGQMPFAGAGVGHGLGGQILGRQARSQRRHGAAYGLIATQIVRSGGVGARAGFHRRSSSDAVQPPWSSASR